MSDPALLSGVAMAAALALLVTGGWAIRQPGSSRVKAGLMMLAGLVIIFNVWVTSLPLPARPPAGAAAPTR